MCVCVRERVRKDVEACEGLAADLAVEGSHPRVDPHVHLSCRV